jgi:hypothetical protein
MLEAEPSQNGLKQDRPVIHWLSFAHLLTAISSFVALLATSGLIVYGLDTLKDYHHSENIADDDFRKLSIEITARKNALLPHLTNLIANKSENNYYIWMDQSIEQTGQKIFPDYKGYTFLSLVATAYSVIPRLTNPPKQLIQDLALDCIKTAINLQAAMEPCLHDTSPDVRKQSCEATYRDVEILSKILNDASFFPIPT